MPESGRPSEEEWLGYFDTLSNWGRWGQDDTRGTLNLITSETVRSAASLIAEGLTVSCARDVSFAKGPREDPGRAQHFMSSTGTAAPRRGGSGAHDWAILPLHGLTLTHVDAHSHAFWNGSMYNGQPASAVTGDRGAQQGSLSPIANGIVGRGVLLDVAALHGLSWLPDSHEISADELTAAAQRQSVSPRAGDILLVRTGYGDRRIHDLQPGDGGEPEDMRPLLPGLGANTLPWMHEHDIAVVGTDTGTDARPSHYSWLAPFHAVAMCAMGMWIVDNLDLESLSRTCERLNRFEFMLSIAAVRLKNATGSPANPIAIF